MSCANRGAAATQLRQNRRLGDAPAGPGPSTSTVTCVPWGWAAVAKAEPAHTQCLP